MSSFKTLAVAGAAAGLTVAAAHAADLAPAPIMQPVAVVQEFSGWYLRGNIGMSNTSVNSIHNLLDTSPGIAVNTVYTDFTSSPFFGAGVGYQFNNWLRFDATGEYRGKSEFQSLQIVSFNGGIGGTDEYKAKLSSWVGLANVYVDLGTWWCITPFVGAGIGFTENRIGAFLDVNTPNAGVAYAADTTKWNVAWALHAGLAYKVTPGFTVELAYRYLNLGDASSGDLITFTGVNNVFNPESFKTLQSHDLMLGVRWNLNEPAAPLPPIVRKG